MRNNYTFMGRNIRVLRRRAGMTLGELAEKIEIQEGPLGRIERGLNAPSAKVIYGISKALGVSTDTIFAETTSELQKIRDLNSDRPCFTRLGRSAIPEKTEAKANQVIDSYFALEEVCNAQRHAGIPFQLFFYKDEDGLESLAQSVRSFLNIKDGVVFDYFELMESFGFRVISAPFMKKIESFSYFDSVNQNAFFFINDSLTPERQLFSLAYELGMIYMWEQFMTSADAEPDAEAVKLAKKFAAFFLMPREAVHRTVKQLGISSSDWSYELLLRIKHRFGVSAETFLYRLRELRLINEKAYREIKKKIKLFYEKSNFAEPDSSKRILTYNGRLWDLLCSAKNSQKNADEIEEIEEILQKLKLKRS